MNFKFYKIFFILLGILLALSCSGSNDNSRKKDFPITFKKQSAAETDSITNAKSATRKKIESALSLFIHSLKTKDASEFKQLMSERGLVVIRNFVSGGYGVRGKDVRGCYAKKEIKTCLSFSVPKEIPIVPAELFQGTIDSGISKIAFQELHDICFKLTDDCTGADYQPSTMQIIDTIGLILRKTGISSDIPSVVILDSGKALLLEAQYITNLPIDAFALFEYANGSYRLRAIINFL
jgi:hypothetical protein